MKLQLTPDLIQSENDAYENTGGTSAECEPLGFNPAFCDLGTGRVYVSRFGDGRPAPFHLLDGLPEELVLLRHPGGRVISVKESVVSGFERGGRFYTRDEAAIVVSLVH